MRRRTIEEVEQERHEWGTKIFTCGSSDSSLNCDAYEFLVQSPRDMDETIRTWNDDADGNAIVE